MVGSTSSDGVITVTVTDDGVGGADPLADRAPGSPTAAALDGTLDREPAGGGDACPAEIPVRLPARGRASRTSRHQPTGLSPPVPAERLVPCRTPHT